MQLINLRRFFEESVAYINDWEGYDAVKKMFADAIANMEKDYEDLPR